MTQPKERFPGIPNEGLDYYQQMVDWRKERLARMTDRGEIIKCIHDDIAQDSRNFLGHGSFDRKFGYGYLVKGELLELIELYVVVDGLNTDVVDKLKEAQTFIKSHEVREEIEWLSLREIYFQAGDAVRIRVWGRRPELVHHG